MNTKSIAILVLTFLLCPFLLFAQESVQKDTASLNKLGRALMTKREFVNTYEERILLLQEALVHFQKSKNWPLIIEIEAEFAELNYYLIEYKKFEEHIDNLKRLVSTHAISEALTIKVKKVMVLRSRMIEDYVESEKLYKEIFEFDKIQSTKIFASASANNIGLFYLSCLSDPQRALDYYQIGVDLLKKSDEPYEPLKATLYSNMGYCYKEINKFQLAQRFFHKSLQVIHTDEVGDLNIQSTWWNYQNLSNIYLNNNQLDSCLYYGQRALSILEKDGKSYWDDYQNYFTLGNYYLKTDSYPLALDYFKKGLIRAKKQKDVFRPVDAIVRFANVLYNHGNHQEALDSLQMGLQLLCPGFKSSDITATPLPQSFAHKKSALKLIEQKAVIFHKQYHENNDPIFLNASLENYKLATEIIQLLRRDFVGDISKYFLAEKVLSIYEDAIEVAYKLYELEGDQKYLEAAFYFAEQNKSILLLESIKENTAKGFGNLPDSLLQQEKEWKLNIAALEKRIYIEKKKTPINQNQTKILSDQLFTLKEKHNNLIASIEKQFPKYYEYKYKPAIASINELQQNYLDPETALLEYFVGEENIFIFCIQKDKTKLLKIQKPKNILASFNQLRAIITQPPKSANYEADLQQFNQLSFSFYNLLIKDLVSTFSGNHLIIIPDNFLSYLPFEILVSNNVNASNFSIKEQSYLLEDFDISYSFSSSLLINTKDINYITQKDFVGFAPSFKDPMAQYSSRNCGDGELYSLQCSEEEVSSINNLFDGKTYSGKLATKDNFESIVNEYNIIHLATHACVDETNPNFSRIYFTDEYLSNFDLTNMRIQANLAVLSACNTNVGPLMKGDGVSSISKGFILAGCPSILTSLWSVDDCSTSQVMINFYHSLKEGNAKSHALHQAKMKYLDQANDVDSHPYYWAPFLLSGDYRAILDVRSATFSQWILGGLFLGLVCFVCFYLYNRSQYKHPGNYK